MTTHLTSATRIASLTGKTAEEIRTAAARLGLAPSFEIDGVQHFSAAVANQLIDALRSA